MRRWLFNFFCVISLLLCIAFAVLWWHSHKQEQAIRWAGETQFYSVVFSRGMFRILFANSGATDYSGWRHSSDPPTRDLWGELASRFPLGRRVGIGYRHQPTKGGYTVHGRTLLYVYVASWLTVVVFAIPPALWVRGWLARRCRIRNRKLRLCPNCGYDVRASRDRCPECGEAIPSAEPVRKPQPSPG